MGRRISDLDFNKEIPLGLSLISLGLSLKCFDTVGHNNPALCTLHPGEGAWSEPACVIKSTGFEGDYVLYSFGT